MYSFDTNINTAVERQADRMNAVRGFRSAEASQQSARDGADSRGQKSQMAAKATLALAAAAPIVALLVWGLMAR